MLVVEVFKEYGEDFVVVDIFDDFFDGMCIFLFDVEFDIINIC